MDLLRFKFKKNEKKKLRHPSQDKPKFHSAAHFD